MQHIVGVGEMRISKEGSDLLVTHGLGSCLGIVVHDPVAQVGGLLHAMLPTAALNPDKAKAQPGMFVDTGVRELLYQMVCSGAAIGRLILKVAGGATMQIENEERLAIGRRNYLTLKKFLWQFDLLVQAEDVGGELPRTMVFEVGSGRVRLSSRGQEKNL
jgi:chemotaxis protein CheD